MSEPMILALFAVAIAAFYVGGRLVPEDRDFTRLALFLLGIVVAGVAIAGASTGATP